MTEEKDRFGLQKLTTNQEVIVSFTLFMAGLLLIISTYLPLMNMYDMTPALLGFLMVVTGYFFAVESIRELEEKDHFLSRLLEKKE